MPQTVAAQLGIPELAGRGVLVTLVDAFKARTALLVLDNCEHLVEASASLVQALLQACPELRILATSREPLLIDGETVWRVPSLGMPEPPLQLEEVAHADSVRLFVDRARAVQVDFQLTDQNASAVAEVCRRLDGIPLALELAAARASALSVEQIAARLDDALGLLVAGRRLVPARQHTVRATLDWSYALLTEPERILFERLSVFAGGWALEAAEAVAGGDGLGWREVLPLLGRLVDTSMVVVEHNWAGQVRYRLLEALRQYGHERLAARGPAEAIHRRHADYFLVFAEEAEPEIFSPRVLAAQARLETEHDNLRAALAWLMDQVDVEGVQRLAGALARFWYFRGYLAEARTWLDRALALPRRSNRPTAGRAKCLYGLNLLAFGHADYAAFEDRAQQARAIWHSLGNAVEEAFCLFHLGFATTRQGKYAQARVHLEAGLAVSRAAGHRVAESACLFRLAELGADLGDHEEARVWAEAALARAMDVAQPRQIADAQSVLGVLCMRQGNLPGAARLLEASLATWRELGARWWVAETLVRLGHLAIEQADIGKARTCLAESLTLAEELNDPFATALAIEGFALVAVLEEMPLLALQLAGAAESLRDSLCTPLPPAQRSHLNRHLARARSTMGEPAAHAAEARGGSLGLPQAIELALAAPRNQARLTAEFDARLDFEA